MCQIRTLLAGLQPAREDSTEFQIHHLDRSASTTWSCITILVHVLAEAFFSYVLGEYQTTPIGWSNALFNGIHFVV